MNRRIVVLLFALLALIPFTTACSSEADVASENISTAADNFEVNRRIVFINGITDKVLLEIEGRCSIKDEGHQLEVTCKISEGDEAKNFFKHFLGLSDNVSYYAEQLEGIDVDVYHYRRTFSPETAIPDIDLRTSGEDPNTND